MSSFFARSVRWMLWGKQFPRKIVFVAGLYTIC